MYKGDSDCWIVFGEAKIEDQSSPSSGFGSAGLQQFAQAEAAEKQQAEARQAAALKAKDDDEDDEDADETGLSAADIDVVVSQVRSALC